MYLLHFGKIISAGTADAGHISFSLPGAFPKRNQDLHSRLQFTLQTFRNPILKNLIQFFILYIYNCIRKHIFTILLIYSLWSFLRVSETIRRSSIGYFFPRIS